jgi:enoyl-CoA hydratase/carnithine racemase
MTIASRHAWAGLTLERLAGDVSVLTIDRPERMNSITVAFFTDLGEAVREISRDGTRALVLTGSGDRAFSAGYDLAELPALLETTVQEFLTIEDTASSAVGGIHALPIPVVAAVNGAAAGGGLSLALAADIRLAATTASFSAAFARVGFSVGELGTSWMLTRVVGPGMAAELAFTGRVVRADEALALGLCDRVVEGDRLRDEAIALATRLADPARSALIGKRTLTSATEASSFAVSLRQGLPDRP